jgi:hypothetical protein
VSSQPVIQYASRATGAIESSGLSSSGDWDGTAEGRASSVVAGGAGLERQFAERMVARWCAE